MRYATIIILSAFVATSGLGIEFRLKPQKLGVFTDGRWTYHGDRFDHGDQNNFGARVGLRWVL